MIKASIFFFYEKNLFIASQKLKSKRSKKEKKKEKEKRQAKRKGHEQRLITAVSDGQSAHSSGCLFFESEWRGLLTYLSQKWYFYYLKRLAMCTSLNLVQFNRDLIYSIDQWPEWFFILCSARVTASPITFYLSLSLSPALLAHFPLRTFTRIVSMNGSWWQLQSSHPMYFDILYNSDQRKTTTHFKGMKPQKGLSF